MIDYTITTDFGAKDSLPSGNAAKVIKGSEFTTEFTNIKTAVNSKADTAGDTFTGAVTFDAAVTLNADVTFDTNTLFIDVSANKVGIGNTSPAYELDVTGSAQLSGGDLILRGDSTDADTQSIRFENASSDDRSAYIRADYSTNSSGNATSLVFGTNPSTGDGSDRMVIDNTGNVGIGTDNPVSRLDVRGDISVGGSGAGATQLGVLRSWSNTADADIYALMPTSSTTSGTIIEGRPNAHVVIGLRDNDNNDSFNVIGTGGTYSDSGSEADNAYDKNLLCVRGTGNVGIGTNSPQRELEVTGTGNVYARITAPTDDDSAVLELKNTQETWQIRNQDTNDDALEFIDDTATRLTIKKDGNVGIGVTSPQDKLHVSTGTDTDSGNIAFTIGGTSTSNGRTASITKNTSTPYELTIQAGNHATSNMETIFKSSDSKETMRIDSSGNVGIGTNAPAKRLHVLGGDIRIESFFPRLYLTDSNNNSDYSIINNNGQFGIYDDTNAAYRMTIDTSGNLLVGTTEQNAFNGGFSVKTGTVPYINVGHASSVTSGNYYAAFRHGTNTLGTITQNNTTGVLYNTSSDERLKENIADSADAGSKVDAIQIRQFDWIADGSHQDYGVIAQELVTVAPEAVHQPEDSEDMMGVDYSKLVPMLIKEVQSLRSRVAELENA